MITLLAFVMVLGILIFVHELGHFILAKRFGIQVDEFAFGYPPRLLKLWQEKGKIVLGGKTLTLGRHTRVPRQVEVGKRILYTSRQEPNGEEVVTQLELVPDNMSDEEASQKYGQPVYVVEQIERGTEYTLNLIPFGGYVRMLGEEDPSAPRSFASKSKRVRVAVLVAGAAMNILLAVVVFTATFMLGAPEPVAMDNVMILGIADGSPAQKVGLRVGDLIKSLDGITVHSPEDLVALTQERLGKEVRLEIRRGEETLYVTLVPRPDPPPGEGAMGVSIQAAISKVDIVYYPLGEALLKGVQQVFNTVALTISVPLLILRGLLPAEAVRPIGPLGIYQQTASAVQATVEMGWWYPILSLLGLISTALAITNLLPLPALDGGRILFILIEAIRGKRVDPAREGFVHFIGLALLVTLMLIISYFDIIQPVTTIDWTSLF
ncbi:MAG: M50 family metallopeptidase [Anaerolineae bacterium]